MEEDILEAEGETTRHHRLRIGRGSVRRAGLRTATVVALLILPGTALAAKAQLGGSGGGKPTPIHGSAVGVSFNPTVTVWVQAYETVDLLLQRLAADINAASEGAYTAQVLEPSTLEITRPGGEEIDDLQFRENDAGIQSVTLSLSRPQLLARIRGVEENPTVGAVIVTLNDRTAVVFTTGISSAAALNQALLQAIRRADFEAEFDSNFIVVRRDLRSGTGLALVGLRSTDPAIMTSDLALLPAAPVP